MEEIRVKEEKRQRNELTNIMSHLAEAQKIIELQDAHMRNREALANRATEEAAKATKRATIATELAERKVEEVVKGAEQVIEEQAAKFGKKVRKAVMEIEALKREYVHRKPVTNKVYKGVMEHTIAGLTQAQTCEVLKDGRPSSFIITAWIKNRWDIAESLQVRMFSDRGCYIAPSFNIGTKRKVVASEVDTKLQSIEKWAFVDIRNYPVITYVFKSADSIIRLSEQNPDYKKTGRIPASAWNKIESVQ